MGQNKRLSIAMDPDDQTRATSHWPLVIRRIVRLALLLAVAVPRGAGAQPYPVPPTWGGDLQSRPRLTGDWGGLRDDLAKKGVVLDVDLLLTPQVNTSGGRSVGGNFWGNLDYTLNLDTQKIGLWPGGF